MNMEQINWHSQYININMRKKFLIVALFYLFIFNSGTFCIHSASNSKHLVCSRAVLLKLTVVKDQFNYFIFPIHWRTSQT